MTNDPRALRTDADAAPWAVIELMTYFGKKKHRKQFREDVLGILAAIDFVQKPPSPMFDDDPDFAERIYDRTVKTSPLNVPPGCHDDDIVMINARSGRLKRIFSVLGTLRGMREQAPALNEVLTGFGDVSRISQARQDNDCSIISTAIACRISYAEAARALRSRGKKDHRGMMTTDILEALDDLGFEHRRLPLGYYLEKLAGHTPHAEHLTTSHVEKFPEVFSNPADRRQIWFTRGHVFTFTGKVEDASPCRKTHVNCVFDVFPKGQHPPRAESMYRDCYLPGLQVTPFARAASTRKG